MECKFKENDIVKVYKNPQINAGFLGEAKLISYLDTSLPFITVEAPSESKQITYATEK